MRVRHYLKKLVASHPELDRFERERLLAVVEAFDIIADSLRGGWECSFSEEIAALRRAVESGVVVWSIVPLPPPVSNWSIFSGKTDDHRRGCGSVAAWLEANGRRWTHVDLNYGGGRADVMTTDQTLVVEVGGTRAHKVINCLENDTQMLLVPYITCGVFGVLLTPHLKENGVETLMPGLRERKIAAVEARALRRTPHVPEDDES